MDSADAGEQTLRQHKAVDVNIGKVVMPAQPKEVESVLSNQSELDEIQAGYSILVNNIS